jgi:hypothetical protein
MKSDLLTAAPAPQDKSIKFVYLAAETNKLLADLSAQMNEPVKNLTLNGVMGVSLSNKIHYDFGDCLLKMPYQPFLSLNEVEKIGYNAPKDILKNRGTFFNRMLDGRLEPMSVFSLMGIIRESVYYIITNMGYNAPLSLDEFKDVRINPSDDDLEFHNLDGMRWFIINVWKKKRPTIWNSLTKEQQKSVEKNLQKFLLHRVSNLGKSFKDEKELVLMNKKLVVPHGSILYDYGYEHFKKERGQADLQRITDLGIKVEFVKPYPTIKKRRVTV